MKEVELPETDRWEVDGQLERLDLLQSQLGALDREIRKRLKASPVAQALEQNPGIGPFIALPVIAEVGDIRRFPTPKSLVSYIGLAPSLYASGEHCWSGPITKQRSGLLRWALVQATHRAPLRGSSASINASGTGTEPAGRPSLRRYGCATDLRLYLIHRIKKTDRYLPRSPRYVEKQNLFLNGLSAHQSELSFLNPERVDRNRMQGEHQEDRNEEA